MNLVIKTDEIKGLHRIRVMAVDPEKSKEERYFPICEYLGKEKKKVIKLASDSITKFLRKNM